MNSKRKKERLLRNIRNIYLRIKGSYVKGSKDVMSIIRKNADNILEDVQMEIIVELEKEGLEGDFYFEVSTIIVDAFMRCKILEEPNNDNR